MINEIKTKLKDKKFLIFSVICIVMMICPFFTILKTDSQKINYIYNEGHVADGIFIILFSALIFLLNLFNFRKSALIPLGFMIIVLGLLFYNINDEGVLKYATFNFYLMYVCLIGLIIFNIMFLLKRKTV